MATYNISIINREFKDINPLVLGWENCVPGHRFGPHIRGYHLLHYVRAGKGVLSNETGTFPVRAGQVFRIEPGQTTVYEADAADPWQYIWVGFTGTLAESFSRLPWVFPCAGNFFSAMLQAEELTQTREEFLAGQVFSLLAHLLEPAEVTATDYVRRVKDFIRSNYMCEVRVEQLAEMVGLDRRYLSRIFKQKSGLTIQDFLIETRLQHATEHLLHGRSVSETASLCGYADVFHFSRMFKQRYGVSPRDTKKDLAT